MKRFVVFSFIVLALGLVACNKSDSARVVDSGIAEGQPIRLVVEARGDVSTKAVGVTSNDTSTEAKVNSLQVFVFNGAALDGYGKSVNSLTATVSCSTGSRKIYALVNAADLSAVTTEADLLASVASLNNNLTSFAMIGSKTESLEYSGNLSIDVNRMAARIVIKSIKNALINDAQASAFHLDAVYITNVAGDVDFGQSGSYVVSSWYNKQGYQSANSLGEVDYDAIDADLAKDATNSTAHYFYSMPNANDAAVGGTWSPRRLKLVVKATIAGVVNYYPITFPALESNKSYEINLLSITRPGNPADGDDPEEKPINGFDQGFEINVLPWTTVLVGDASGNVTI